MKKIYICYSGEPEFLHAHAIVGICEDWKLDSIAWHLCSNESFVKHDMWITSDWKHDIYDKEYPDWWQLEWFWKIEDEIDVQNLKDQILADNEE